MNKPIYNDLSMAETNWVRDLHPSVTSNAGAAGLRTGLNGLSEVGITFTIDSAWLWDYRIKRRPVSLALPNVDSTVKMDRGRYSRRLHRFSNRYGRGTLFHKEQSKTLVPEQ